MRIKKNLEPINPERPSQKAKELSEYFELELIKQAVDSYNDKDYLRASMLSWSCIEECFLPQLIGWVAKRHNMKLEKDFIEKSNAQNLNKYYLLISLDNEMFNLLEKARKCRNKLIHNIYKSGSLSKLEKYAKESAKCNLSEVIKPLTNRLSGKIPIPSLELYANGWNDARGAFLNLLDSKREELKRQFSK